MPTDVQSISDDVPRRERIGERRRTPTLLLGANVGTRFALLFRRNKTGAVEDRERLALLCLYRRYEIRSK